MKKLVFALAAMFAVSLVSCDSFRSTDGGTSVGDSIPTDSLVVDSLNADQVVEGAEAPAEEAPAEETAEPAGK